MDVEKYFELFLKEIETKPHMWGYYKFHKDNDNFLFRKAYLCQRLEYIIQNLKGADSEILDIGCGYGTTAIFLALNGIKVHGTTLEFYIKEIESRKDYWRQYGDVDKFTVSYENLFDNAPVKQYDSIIIQDTLHHLEPIEEAISIIAKTLKVDGKLIVIEENGDNIVQTLKLIKQRGFKRVKYMYDESLKKEILIGDENIRGYQKWKSLFSKAGLQALDETQHYVRYYYPSKFTKENYQTLIESEQNIWKESPFKRKYFFFGMNFIVTKAK